MPNIFIETYQEFVAKHGGDPVEIDNALCFPDGARCGFDPDGYPRWEPPTDPYELLSLKYRYAKERLRRAELEFNTVKNEFQQRAILASKYRNLPGPPANAPEILEHLRTIAHERRAAFEAIEQQIADTPRAQYMRQRQEEEQQRQEGMSQVYRCISEFNL